MLLEGSCHCGAVQFSVESETPYPFMRCYCSICRKLVGPFGVNIMGLRATLKVRGRRHLKMLHAVIRNPGQRAVRSSAERWFCGTCGTHLWLQDDEWPDGVWPSACAIDTPLPEPPEYVHLMLAFKPKWVTVDGRGPRFPRYPKLSIAEWHARHGLTRRVRRPRARPTRR
jgi:hypothetical protein